MDQNQKLNFNHLKTNLKISIMIADIEKSKTADEKQISEAIQSLVVANGMKGYNALLTAVDKIVKTKIKERDVLVNQAQEASNETAHLINGIQKSMESLR